MSEALEWMILVGLAVAIAGIFMLSTQIERLTHRTLEMMIHSNAMIAARLERADGPSADAGDPYTRDLFERRLVERRKVFSGGRPAPGRERRSGADRRSADRARVTLPPAGS